VKVLTSYDEFSVNGIIKSAQFVEAVGYDVFSASETQHNPYLPLVLAAEHTNRIQLQTSIALAFARSPMDTAYLAWDIQKISQGRFVLGLGSQVRGHIVRRFSMPWSSPAPRMREYIAALRHIWDCWQDQKRLNFSGDHYSFDLMSPFFDPGPMENPKIEIFLAGVNPKMLQVAGELADGVILHAFNTAKYTEEVILPNLKKGLSKSDRSIEDIEIVTPGFIVTGGDEQEIERGKSLAKERIAFYASTPSYKSVMEIHGWEDTYDILKRMSMNGEWGKMSSEITDDMLATFAVVGTHCEIANKIKLMYGFYSNSVGFSMPIKSMEDRERLRSIVRDIQKV